MHLLAPFLLLLLPTLTYSKPPPPIPDSAPVTKDPSPHSSDPRYGPFNIVFRRFNNVDCSDFTGKKTGPKKFGYAKFIAGNGDGHCQPYYMHKGRFKSFDYKWDPAGPHATNHEYREASEAEVPDPGSGFGMKRTCAIWLYSGNNCEGEEINILDHANTKAKMMQCIPVQDRQGVIRAAVSIRVKCWNVPADTS